MRNSIIVNVPLGRAECRFEDWTELDRKKRFRLDDRAVHGQIYDLLGFGGLSIEIVEYVFELLDESEIDRVKLFQRLHTFYERWCEGEFLDQAPTENLPQKKFLQLREQDIADGLKQVDVFTGLNVLIVLFKLHAAAQPESYPNVSDDETRTNIWFHPCGAPSTKQFRSGKLLKIIHYADALGTSTFTRIVGLHLFKANLSGANLNSVNLNTANLSGANLNSVNLNTANLLGANLDGVNLNKANLLGANLIAANLSSANLNNANLIDANLNSAKLINANLIDAKLINAKLINAKLAQADLFGANLSNTILVKTQLSEAQNLNIQQLEGENPPLICAALPSDLEAYQNRDRNRSLAFLIERYPEIINSLEEAEKYINLEEAEKYINDNHPPSP